MAHGKERRDMTGQSVGEQMDPETRKLPPNLFSGQMLKMGVYGKPGTDPNDPIPGFELCWIDDVNDGTVIGGCLASGWEFVKKDEIASLNDAPVSPGNNALDDHVRRWVTTAPGGGAVYSHLMKKPKWIADAHREEVEQKVHMVLENQLRSGTFKDSPDQKRYTANTVPAGHRSTGHVAPIIMGRSRRTPS